MKIMTMILHYFLILLAVIIVKLDESSSSLLSSSSSSSLSSSNSETTTIDYVHNFPRNNYTRIILIGDSCDRYAIHDWCDHHHGVILQERDKLATNFSYPVTFHDLFRVHGQRRRSWEVRVCECAAKQISLTFFFHKFGVKTERPWHTPIATMADVDSQLVPGMTMEALWDVAQRPAIVPLMRAMGGWPHGVSLSSAFWDLSHPDMTGLRTNHSNIWLEQWKHNTTDLMRIIEKEFSPHSQSEATNRSKPWFGWRTASKFIPQRENLAIGHWNTHHALQLLHKMNAIITRHAPTHGFHIVDTLEKDSGSSMRDFMHPSPAVGIRFVDEVIRLTKEHMQAQQKHKHHRHNSRGES